MTKAITGHQLIYVADSSNIEARMLAWEAGHEPLLEQFRAKQDVYSNFASEIYGFPVNKHDHKIERFVGKTCVLGLGYGTGWRKLKDSLATSDPPVFIDEIEAQRIVNLYRSVNEPIRQYWRQADQAIIDMYMGNSRQWGPLTIHRNCLVMPNGMALQYPGLRPTDPSEDGTLPGGWEYWNGKFWTRLYGAKLCLAEGTLVLTQKGWQPIEEITEKTAIWDGEEWVYCDGNVYNGDKPVIELAGIPMTPDHEVLTDEGWKTASQSQGHNRAESRLPDGPEVRWERWEEIPVVDSLHLRDREATHRDRPDKMEKARRNPLVWLQKIRNRRRPAENPRDVETPGLRGVAVDGGQVPLANPSSLGQLRRAWHSGMQAVAGVLRSLLGRHGRLIPAWADSGPGGQRPTLHPGKLPVGDTRGAGQQPPHISTDQRQDSKTAIAGDRDRGINSLVPFQSWLALGQAVDPARRNQPVYDLINCGPRNRFVVRDAYGKPLIVHNCENITQALARIVLFRQMLDINRLFEPYDGRVVLNVHDEIVAVGPSFGARYHGIGDDGKEVWSHADQAQELFDQMLGIMRTQPTWCPDLPLDGEGGFDFMYVK